LLKNKWDLIGLLSIVFLICDCKSWNLSQNHMLLDMKRGAKVDY